MPGSMWRVSAIFACLFAVASAGDAAAEACSSNAVADGGDDKCELLQGGVGVVSAHQKGLPDILKKVADVVGGTDKFEKDFQEVANEVGKFSQQVREAISVCKANIKSSSSVQEVTRQVEVAYHTIHEAALKFYHAIAKTDSDFDSGVGKVLPAGFASELKKILNHIKDKAKHFADAVEKANHQLKEEVTKEEVNVTKEEVCEAVKHGIQQIEEKAQEVAKSAFGLSKEGLSKELKKAMAALPENIKHEIKKIMEMANAAASNLNTLPKQVQEIAKGVMEAFKGKCSIDSAAGRLQVGILSSLVLVMLNFLI